MISIDYAGKDNIQVWGPAVANLWTTTPRKVTTWSTLENVLWTQTGYQYAKAGAWNDAGPLSSILKADAFLVQLAAWLALKSPITLPLPLQLEPQQLQYILNDELLAIGQDELGEQAQLLKHVEFWSGWQEVWGGRLTKNRYLLVFINGVTTSTSMCVSLKTDAHLVLSSSYWIRDPVRGRTLGSSSADNFTLTAVPTNSVEVRVLHL